MAEQINESETADHLRQSHLPFNFPHCNLAKYFCRIFKQLHSAHNMPSALLTTETTSSAHTALVPTALGNFRDNHNQDSDASDGDQSDTSRRSLSPTRQGLSKAKKRKERRTFGAFADELGDLLGSAFQSKDEPNHEGLAASTHAGRSHGEFGLR